MSKHKKLRTRLQQAEGLADSAIGELTFSNSQQEHLLDTLSEIEDCTNDPLARSIIKNAKERHHLLKMKHARELFE